MNWREEVVWRQETRQLLEVELGARVIDFMRPPAQMPINLMPESGKRSVYGPINSSVSLGEKYDYDFHTTDVQEGNDA